MTYLPDDEHPMGEFKTTRVVAIADTGTPAGFKLLAPDQGFVMRLDPVGDGLWLLTDLNGDPVTANGKAMEGFGFALESAAWLLHTGRV